MAYLLDTNAWIAYLRGRSPPLLSRLATVDPTEIKLCSVVEAELYYGAYKSPNPPVNLNLLSALQSRFDSVPFDTAAGAQYGRVRARLESNGRPIGPYDMMIAAIALTNGLTLVTHNTAEFSRVPSLALTDWETP